MNSNNNVINNNDQARNSHQLDPNFQDGIAAVVRSASGLIPYFGDSIAELITAQMGNQWKDRITQFVKDLEIKTNYIDEYFIALLQNPAMYHIWRQIIRNKMQKKPDPNESFKLFASIEHSPNIEIVNHNKAYSEKFIRYFLDHLSDDRKIQSSSLRRNKKL